MLVFQCEPTGSGYLRLRIRHWDGPRHRTPEPTLLLHRKPIPMFILYSV